MTVSSSNDGNREQIFRSYKTELAPNRAHSALLKAHADAARFAWNWGLGRKQDVLSFNKLHAACIKIPTAIDLHRELVVLKRTSHPWLYKVSKCAPQEALRDLDRAFKNLWKRGFGWPKFKSRKWAKRSFRLNGPVVVADNAIRLPRLGWIRLQERGYIPQGLRVKFATISETAGRWFVSANVDEEQEVAHRDRGPTVGVDFGITRLMTVSGGMVVENPRALLHMERKLKRLQRSKDRKRKGSKNRAKASLKLARHHFRIANVRKDALHKATTALAKANSVIVVEDLSVRGMMRNHRLAKFVADAGFGEGRRQLEYKAVMYGSRVIVADRWYPSSKRCSECHHVNERELEDYPTFVCESCGFRANRDWNASLNLGQWPLVRRTLETSTRAERLQVVRPVLGDDVGIIGQAGMSYSSTR